MILASGSPRRRDLLHALGLQFEVQAADIDETPLPGEAPDALVSRLSKGKARAVAASHADSLVIAADTVVVLAEQILGKPRNSAENRAFLHELSGKSHAVFTGHSLVYGERHLQRVVKTEVCFRDLSEREIDWYISTGEGLDKAGGYAIQGYGSVLVKEICGCYFNVVGLSVAQVAEMAQALGVSFV